MTTVLLADDHAAIRAGVRMILETAQQPVEVVGEASSATAAVDLTRSLRPDVVLLDIRMPGASGLSVIGALRESGAAVIMLTSFALDEYVLAALEAGAEGFLVKSAEPQEIVAAVHRVVSGDAVLSPEVLRAVIDRAVTRPATARPPAAAVPTAEPTSPITPTTPEAPLTAHPGSGRDPHEASGERGGPSPDVSSGVPHAVPDTFPHEPLTRREEDVLRLLAEGCSNQEIAHRLVVAESTVKTHVSHVLTKLEVTSRVQAALWWGRHGRGG